MTTKEKIRHMLEMQKTFDDRVLQGKEYPHAKMQIALFVELGELMNELPTKFKHWKKTAVDDREKALEELVDCWHFAISLANNNKGFFEKNYEKLMELHYNSDVEIYDLHELLLRISSYPLEIARLTKKLGFTIDEVYTGYIAKNQINHKRQDDNY